VGLTRKKLPDLQVAGIAVAHGLKLATRNVGAFDGFGIALINIALINPWEA
jgi:predicted nucleic acid-binding protein